MRTQSTLGLSTEGLDGARPPCRDAGSASVTTQWMTGCRSGDRSSPSHSSRPAQISRRCLSSAMPCTARTCPPSHTPQFRPNPKVSPYASCYLPGQLCWRTDLSSTGTGTIWLFSRVHRKTRQGSCCEWGRWHHPSGRCRRPSRAPRGTKQQFLDSLAYRTRGAARPRRTLPASSPYEHGPLAMRAARASPPATCTQNSARPAIGPGRRPPPGAPRQAPRPAGPPRGPRHGGRPAARAAMGRPGPGAGENGEKGRREKREKGEAQWRSALSAGGGGACTPGRGCHVPVLAVRRWEPVMLSYFFLYVKTERCQFWP